MQTLASLLRTPVHGVETAGAEPGSNLYQLFPPRQGQSGAGGHSRVGFLTRDARLTPDSQDIAALVPAESIEAEAVRQALHSRQSILRPTVDALGRTIILAYSPEDQAGPGALEAQVCTLRLTSMLLFGEDLRQAARQFGMSNLAARVCVALVENGSLRRAAAACGVTHQTASSEIADAMRTAGVTSQSALVHRLAEDWLGEDLDSERVIELLMATFGLTLRDARVASLRALGLGRPETANRLGLSRWSVEDSCATVFSTLGVIKAPDLTRIVIDLMLTSELAERDSRAPARMTART